MPNAQPAASATTTLFAVAAFVAGCGGGGTSPNPPPPPPPPAPVASVTVALSAASAIVGQTVQATATVRDAAGNALAGRTVVWSSDAPAVASVSATGLVTANIFGAAQIIATSEGVTGAHAFAALPSAESVYSVVLSLDSVDVIIGDTVRLTAVARDANGTPLPGIELAWSSTDTSVVTVSPDGLVTSVDFGEAAIDVAVTGPSPTAAAGVAPSAAAGKGRHTTRSPIYSQPKIVVSPGAKTVEVGDPPIQYTATLTNAKNTLLRNPPPYRWSSSSVSAATIDPKTGSATPVGKGKTNIAATITVGLTHLVSSGVPLTVGVCGGLIEVASWSADVSALYSPLATLMQGGDEYAFNVDHFSTGKATLHRIFLKSDSTEAQWEGIATGTVRVNDKVVQSGGNPKAVIGTSTDVANGPEQSLLAHVTLGAFFSPQHGCQYSIRFQDGVTYSHINTPDGSGNYTAQSSSGIAANKFVPAGTKPAGGWRFDELIPVPALLFPGTILDDGDLSSLANLQYYVPVTPVAGSMLLLSPGNRLGMAAFHYLVIAQ